MQVTETLKDGLKRAYTITVTAAELDAKVNEKLVDNPGLVNSDPTGAAWFFKLKLDDLSVLDAFMDEDEYLDLIG